MAGHWAPLPLALALALAVPRRVALYCVPIGGRLCSAGVLSGALNPCVKLSLPCYGLYNTFFVTSPWVSANGEDFREADREARFCFYCCLSFFQEAMEKGMQWMWILFLMLHSEASELPSRGILS
ncbi:hypothetical protein BRADI_3g07680v3 [Brachypodium distachyon]|uniref:Uncharacterized protein n=1 Tax=Brachypodium distachyon TaxID=15368 RepID=I1HYK5_BRADI|nr:hypothetical protein BRADI_3g07680v3 [Brachypodium distachyon]